MHTLTYLTKNWKHVPWITHCYKSINNTISNLQTSVRHTCKLSDCLWQHQWQSINNFLPHHQTIYEVVNKLHITLISNNQHNEENIKPGPMKANTNIHEFLKELPMHCSVHPHYQDLIKQHLISSLESWQAPRPSFQIDVNLPLQSTTRYT